MWQNHSLFSVITTQLKNAGEKKKKRTFFPSPEITAEIICFLTALGLKLAKGCKTNVKICSDRNMYIEGGKKHWRQTTGKLQFIWVVRL